LLITEEHLKHWLQEMKYQLISIEKEINEHKLGDVKGVSLSVASPPSNVFVSFEYLREKAFTLAHLVKSIEDDMRND